MRLKTIVFLLGLIVCLAVVSAGYGAVVPKYTVIPVLLDGGLGSGSSRVGDVFNSHCADINCGGFPAGTTFVGRVVSVTPKYGNTPGQIGVRFIQAILPSGKAINIDGTLASLHDNAVTIDRNSGRMMANVKHRNDRNKFIAYGGGAGFVIGALTGGVLKGTIIGSAAGWLFGALQKGKGASDVTVPAGTRLGIMLAKNVTLPQMPPPVGYNPPPTSGSGPAGQWNVVFRSQQPFVSNNGSLMLPFREVVEGIRQPFSYKSSTRTVVLNTTRGLITHDVGSMVAYVSGVAAPLSASSRFVGGTLFVPSDFVTVVTGKSVTWLPDSRTLRIG